MAGRRLTGAIAAITIPVALAVQTVIAAGGTPPPAATPGPPERGGSIDPGFVVGFEDQSNDTGFIVKFKDRSNDAGFTVIPGGPLPEPSPSPPAPGTPPALTFSTP